MSSDHLDRYAIEVGGVADEMMTYIGDRDRGLLDAIVSKPGGLEALLSPDDQTLKRSCVFLGQAPSQLRKSTEKLRERNGQQLLQIILAAHALGEMARDSLRYDRGNSHYIGLGYRAVARNMAEYLVSDREELRRRMTEKIEVMISPEAERALELIKRRAARDGKPERVRVAARDITTVDLSVIKQALDDNMDLADHAYDQVCGPEGEGKFSLEMRNRYSRIYSNAKQALKDFERLAIDLDQEEVFSSEGDIEEPGGL